MMTHTSPFASSELVLTKVVGCSTPHEDDSGHSLHLCEGERLSPLSTKFQPLPAGPYHVAFDHDRESTLSFHDDSLEMENSWAMEPFEALTLESGGKDSTHEHGGFILDSPYRLCSHHVPLESDMLSALSTHEGYNHLLVLFCKTFGRLIVDAYVYHKHCRFRVSTVALTLQLKLP